MKRSTSCQAQSWKRTRRKIRTQGRGIKGQHNLNKIDRLMMESLPISEKDLQRLTTSVDDIDHGQSPLCIFLPRRHHISQKRPTLSLDQRSDDARPAEKEVYAATSWRHDHIKHSLAVIACEGITGLRVPSLQAFSEPGHALFRGAVRPALRLDIALSHLLEPVVSDGGSGFQAFFEIARLDEIPITLGVVAPDAGETVSLKFHSH